MRLFSRSTRISVVLFSLVAASIACSSGADDSSTASGGRAAGTGSQGSGSANTGGGFSEDGIETGAGGTAGDANLGGADTGFGANPGTDPNGGVSCDCGGVACQCSDGIDNDGDSPDGVLSIDGLDIECTGACDDDEGSFATGIPGDNKDPHQDCFFDGDSGAGNDGCRDPEDPSEECLSFCAPLTPNGCDCFGCCTVALENGETTTVQLGGTCTDADQIEDPTKCEPCTQSEACQNECGECELCPGRDPADIPASCFPNSGSGGGDGSGSGGGPGYVCDNGAIACSSSEDCNAGDYCQTGCCVTVIFK